MDALSDLLRVVRFSGGLFLESNWRAPWCVRSQVVPGDCGPCVKAGGGLVGQDTRDVLETIKRLSAAEIDRMQADGNVACAATPL